jgi:hypothetical protein
LKPKLDEIVSLSFLFVSGQDSQRMMFKTV